jgi:hypothetical protein
MQHDLTATVAAGAGTTTIKTGSGQLRRVLCTVAGTGTGTVNFYDNTAGSGTIIGQVAANAAAGTFAIFDMPAGKGITVVNPANGPAMTVSFA